MDIKISLLDSSHYSRADLNPNVLPRKREDFFGLSLFPNNIVKNGITFLQGAHYEKIMGCHRDLNLPVCRLC